MQCFLTDTDQITVQNYLFMFDKLSLRNDIDSIVEFSMIIELLLCRLDMLACCMVGTTVGSAVRKGGTSGMAKVDALLVLDVQFV